MVFPGDHQLGASGTIPDAVRLALASAISFSDNNAASSDAALRSILTALNAHAQGASKPNKHRSAARARPRSLTVLCPPEQGTEALCKQLLDDPGLGGLVLTGMPGSVRSGATGAADMVLEVLAAHGACQQLSSLCLCNVAPLSEHAITRLLSSLTVLSHLTLPMDVVRPEVVTAAFHGFISPSLARAASRFPPSVRRMSFTPAEWLLSQLPATLTSLNLTDCVHLTPHALTNISRLERLARLQIHGLLASNTPDDLSMDTQLRGEAVNILSSCFTKLTCLTSLELVCKPTTYTTPPPATGTSGTAGGGGQQEGPGAEQLQRLLPSLPMRTHKRGVMQKGNGNKSRRKASTPVPMLAVAALLATQRGHTPPAHTDTAHTGSVADQQLSPPLAPLEPCPQSASCTVFDVILASAPSLPICSNLLICPSTQPDPISLAALGHCTALRFLQFSAASMPLGSQMQLSSDVWLAVAALPHLHTLHLTQVALAHPSFQQRMKDTLAQALAAVQQMDLCSGSQAGPECAIEAEVSGATGNSGAPFFHSLQHLSLTGVSGPSLLAILPALLWSKSTTPALKGQGPVGLPLLTLSLYEVTPDTPPSVLQYVGAFLGLERLSLWGIPPQWHTAISKAWRYSHLLHSLRVLDIRCAVGSSPVQAACAPAARKPPATTPYPSTPLAAGALHSPPTLGTRDWEAGEAGDMEPPDARWQHPQSAQDASTQHDGTAPISTAMDWLGDLCDGQVHGPQAGPDGDEQGEGTALEAGASWLAAASTPVCAVGSATPLVRGQQTWNALGALGAKASAGLQGGDVLVLEQGDGKGRHCCDQAGSWVSSLQPCAPQKSPVTQGRVGDKERRGLEPAGDMVGVDTSDAEQGVEGPHRAVAAAQVMADQGADARGSPLAQGGGLHGMDELGELELGSYITEANMRDAMAAAYAASAGLGSVTRRIAQRDSGCSTPMPDLVDNEGHLASAHMDLLYGELGKAGTGAVPISNHGGCASKGWHVEDVTQAYGAEDHHLAAWNQQHSHYAHEWGCQNGAQDAAFVAGASSGWSDGDLQHLHSFGYDCEPVSGDRRQHGLTAFTPPKLYNADHYCDPNTPGKGNGIEASAAHRWTQLSTFKPHASQGGWCQRQGSRASGVRPASGWGPALLDVLHESSEAGTRLQSVTLHRAPGITEQAMFRLAGLPRMRQLDVRYCAGLTPERSVACCDAIARSMSHLQSCACKVVIVPDPPTSAVC